MTGTLILGKYNSNQYPNLYIPHFTTYMAGISATNTAATVSATVDLLTGARAAVGHEIHVAVNSANAGHGLSLYVTIDGVDYLVSTAANTTAAKQMVRFSGLLAGIYKIVLSTYGGAAVTLNAGGTN